MYSGVIQLSLLGALALRDAEGRDIRPVLVRPKRLALLAYLAAADSRQGGWQQRNELLALFWPESDEKRARFSLRNALSALRADLGGDAIQVRGDEEVAANRDVVRCDVRAFEDALDRGDPEGALESYQGPLLSGVVLPGLSEFQLWVDARRETLRRRAADAAATLADRTERAGDIRTALHWVRRLEALSPYEEVVLRRELELLEKSGDRVAAAHAYRSWTDRLRADLESEPSVETVAMMQRIRTATGPAATATRTTSAADTAAATEPPSYMKEIVGAASAIPSAIAPPAPAALPRPAVRGSPRRLYGAIGVVAFVAVAAVAVMTLNRRADEAAESTGTVVMPFAYDGDPAAAYLSDALASLLAASLGNRGSMAAIDPRSVAALVAERHPVGASALDVTGARAVARQLHARYVIAGTVVTVQRMIRVEASLYEVGHDPAEPSTALASATAEGPVDSVFAVADRVSHDLLASRIGGVSTATLGTTSLPALRAYVTGERELAAGRYAPAADAFEQAVAADTMFARGYYRLGYASGWAARNDRALAATARALALAARLNTRDAALLAAWSDFFGGRIQQSNERYQEILSHDGRSVEAWLQLGELRFHWGAMLGIAPGEAALAFRRAVALAPDQSVALVHLARFVARELPRGQTAPFDSLVREAAGAPGSLDPTEAIELRAMAAVLHADTAAQARVVAEVRQRPVAAGQLGRLLLPVPGSARMVNALAHVLTRSAAPSDAEYGWLQLAQLHAMRGRFRAAAAALDTLYRVSPARAAEGRAWLALVPMHATAARDLAAIDAALARGRDSKRPVDQRYLRGAIALRRGDTAAATAHWRTLSRLSAGAAQAPDEDPSRRAAVYARLLHAQLVAIRSPAAAIAELGTLSIQPGNTFPDLFDFVNAYERYLRATWLAASGRAEEALRWFDTIPDASSYDAWFLGPALLARSRLRAAAGSPGLARADSLRLSELWRDADVR